jgi:hypothetical protein
MFGNLAIPLTNAIVGEITMAKEITGGNVINKSDYAAGKRLFASSALGSLVDMMNRVKKTKFARVYTYFNLNDKHNDINDLGISTNYVKTVFQKITRGTSEMVDFYFATTALGATLNRFKAVDPSGKEVSLYDAIDITKTGKVELQPGYTYKGKKSINGADISEIKEYGLRVNQLMNGVYNKMDKAPMNEYIVGRYLGFMRNWLKAGVDTRWRTLFHDERLKMKNEGHYVSALIGFNNMFGEGGFVQGSVDAARMLIWAGVRDPNLLLLPNELNKSQQEKDDLINLRKANIRKTLFELYLLVGISVLLGFGWGDDDDSYLAYPRLILARVRRELNTYLSPTTAWDVLRSPTVALSTIESLNKVISSAYNTGKAGITGGEQPVYERGPGKGQHKLAYDTKKFLGLGFINQFDDMENKTRLVVKGYR